MVTTTILVTLLRAQLRRVGIHSLFILATMLIVGCADRSTQLEAASLTLPPSPASPASDILPTESKIPAAATSPPTIHPPATATATATAVPTRTPSPEPTPEPTIDAARPDIPGALIQVSMQSQVGVLLDEIPLEVREQFVDFIQAQPISFWEALARRQIRLTRLRLNFRDFSNPGKGRLPLPRPQLWEISVDAAGPQRQTIQGHDLLMQPYTFAATILTDIDSPSESEPALAEVGGVWEEPFAFPASPDFLVQRTGNACLNEGGFPPNSYDSVNYWHFYDFTCTVESGGATGCHRTQLPNFSCLDALRTFVGTVESTLQFERLAWDDTLAHRVRTNAPTSPNTPDLAVVGEDLDTNRISYRYIEPDDCALAEGAVGSSGWRRLLQFDATVFNVGAAPLHVGQAQVEDTINHVFEYNLCHDHFHYSNYGDFFLRNLAQQTGSKQAFCVQSTDRFSNHEASPLNHAYSCRFQGIQVGWVDEYIAGLDAQWIDITDLDIPTDGRTVDLGFVSNGDRFLCEGTSLVDAAGAQLWEVSGLTNAAGQPINRPSCDFPEGWDSNNRAERPVSVSPTGSFVTEPCRENESGPLRNCGFTDLETAESDSTCVPGTTVNLNLPENRTTIPQVVRACEYSAALGTGVACTYEDSLTNVIGDAGFTAVSFICPSVRDAETTDAAGRFVLYSAPLWVDES